MSVPITVAAPRRPFMSSGPMIRQSALALVIATVARAYASSSWTICSSSGRARKYFLRIWVRNPTLVWARMTVWAVMPAQVVTPLETMESWDSETQLLTRNKLVTDTDVSVVAMGMHQTLSPWYRIVQNKLDSSTTVYSFIVVRVYHCFFFLHCRTSARLGRSTTGVSLWLKTNFPKERNQQPTQQNKQQKQHTHTSQGESQATQSGKFAD